MSAVPETEPQEQTVPRAKPAQVAPLFGIGRLVRHILVCTGPSCCDPDDGARTWGHFKRRLASLGLTGHKDDGPAVYRTRCDCLRMCADGPIVVVYPEGAWYQNVDSIAAERIVREHVVGGRVVEDLCFALNPLPGGIVAIEAPEPGRQPASEHDAPSSANP